MLKVDVNKVLKTGLFVCLSSCLISSLSYADPYDDVEQDGQSYSGQMEGANSDADSQREITVTKDTANKNIYPSAARDLTLTRGIKDAYYKLPRLEKYTPKPLSDEARSIAILNGVPLLCKFMGEVEGIDGSDGRAAPSFEEIREGALNDLRNATLDLVDSQRDKVVITPTKEAMTCETMIGENQYEESNCTSWTKIPNNGKILYYRIHANVYACGR